MGTADHMASYDGVAEKGGANNGVAGNVVATLSFVNNDCILGNETLDDGRRGCHDHIHWDSG